MAALAVAWIAVGVVLYAVAYVAEALELIEWGD